MFVWLVGWCGRGGGCGEGGATGVGYRGGGVVAKGSMGVRVGRQGFHETMLKNPNWQRTGVWMGPAINQARHGPGSNRGPSNFQSGTPQPSYPGDGIDFDATKIVVLTPPRVTHKHTHDHLCTNMPSYLYIYIYIDFCAKRQAAVFMCGWPHAVLPVGLEPTTYGS